MAEDRSNPLEAGDLRVLFHRLNNQLAVILAQAELLEAKAPDTAHQTRAAQIVSAALDAMTVTRSLRDRLSPPSGR